MIKIGKIPIDFDEISMKFKQMTHAQLSRPTVVAKQYEQSKQQHSRKRCGGEPDLKDSP